MVRIVAWVDNSSSNMSNSLGKVGKKIGFPGGSDGKESTCNVGDLGSIPGLGRALEEGMATHSSILAWKIPWTEDPGKLQSIGSQGVRHD